MEQPDETQSAEPVKAAGPTPETALQLFKRARNGDRSALEPIKEVLRTMPGAAITLGGDLSREAMSLLIRKYAGKDLVIREAITQRLADLQAELCGENRQPTGVERLLIEDVLGTWLHLHRLEVMYAVQERPTYMTDSYYQKELSAAHRRYLASLRALIDARRRPLPNVQINVANEQVNIATNVAPPTG